MNQLELEYEELLGIIKNYIYIYYIVIYNINY